MLLMAKLLDGVLFLFQFLQLCILSTHVFRRTTGSVIGYLPDGTRFEEGAGFAQ
jgi:hypothetical protein